jgi:prohibitin 2
LSEFLGVGLEYVKIAIILVVVAVFIWRWGDDLWRAISGSRKRREMRMNYDYRGASSEEEPDFGLSELLNKHKWKFLIGVFLIITAVNCLHTVPPGHRGVIRTLGKVEQVNLPEGLALKMPYIQSIVDMKVMLEKEQVHESAASSDLQEITTTLTVHFNIEPTSAWRVYQTMRQDYHDLLLRPVIQEDLKATTAKFTAEELITTRAQLVLKLTEKLRESLAPYGIYVQTVNFVDFQFSKAFSEAIEAKVTAEQDALKAKNILVRIEYEAQQKIIQAEADKNATIIAAEADARKVEIAALAEAFKLTTEANATAEAIMLITNQMTPEYARFLQLTRWDGKYPTTMLGTVEDLGLLIQTP